MSKPKDLYIYVGHEPINLTWKHGQVIKVQAKNKKNAIEVIEACKTAIKGYYQNSAIDRSEVTFTEILD